MDKQLASLSCNVYSSIHDMSKRFLVAISRSVPQSQFFLNESMSDRQCLRTCGSEHCFCMPAHYHCMLLCKQLKVSILLYPIYLGRLLWLIVVLASFTSIVAIQMICLFRSTILFFADVVSLDCRIASFLQKILIPPYKINHCVNILQSR